MSLLSTYTVPPSIGADVNPSGITRAKVTWAGVISKDLSPPVKTNLPSLSTDSCRDRPSAASMSFFTFGASLPNTGPRALMTGSARIPIRSQDPSTTVTLFAFALFRAIDPRSRNARATSGEVVSTTHSATGQRSFRFAACRAFATASSNERTTDMADSRSLSVRDGFGPGPVEHMDALGLSRETKVPGRSPRRDAG